MVLVVRVNYRFLYDWSFMTYVLSLFLEDYCDSVVVSCVSLSELFVFLVRFVSVEVVWCLGVTVLKLW